MNSINTNQHDVEQLKKIANVMDSAFRIPGTEFRVGLDSVIGLIPGVGDVFGLVVSSYFIFVGAKLGVSRAVLTRMFFNMAIDSAVGSIPIAGDIFDMAWKSNRKNLALIERSLIDQRAVRNRSMLFLGTLVLATVTLLALIIFAIVKLAEMIFAEIG